MVVKLAELEEGVARWNRMLQFGIDLQCEHVYLRRRLGGEGAANVNCRRPPQAQ